MNVLRLYINESGIDLKKYRWLRLIYFIVAFILSSVTIYTSAYHGLNSLKTIGTFSLRGQSLFGNIGTSNLLSIIGNYNSLPSNSQSVYPLFILFTIEILGMIFVVLALRIQSFSSVKAIAINYAMAIILVISLLIMQNMASLLGLG